MDGMNMLIATGYRSDTLHFNSRNLNVISANMFVNISQFGSIHELFSTMVGDTYIRHLV
jgi:hypothetical protein